MPVRGKDGSVRVRGAQAGRLRARLSLILALAILAVVIAGFVIERRTRAPGAADAGRVPDPSSSSLATARAVFRSCYDNENPVAFSGQDLAGQGPVRGSATLCLTVVRRADDDGRAEHFEAQATLSIQSVTGPASAVAPLTWSIGVDSQPLGGPDAPSTRTWSVERAGELTEKATDFNVKLPPGTRPTFTATFVLPQWASDGRGASRSVAVTVTPS